MVKRRVHPLGSLPDYRDIERRWCGTVIATVDVHNRWWHDAMVVRDLWALELVKYIRGEVPFICHGDGEGV